MLLMNTESARSHHSSVGGAAVIKPEGRGFNSHPSQSFPLFLCGPISICRANAHIVYGLKHQHFTSHSITLFVLNISATRPYVANAT